MNTKRKFLNEPTYDTMIQELDQMLREIRVIPGLIVSSHPLRQQYGINIIVTILYNDKCMLTDKRLSYISSKITPILQKYHAVAKKGYVYHEVVQYYIKPNWQYWIDNPMEVQSVESNC